MEKIGFSDLSIWLRFAIAFSLFELIVTIIFLLISLASLLGYALT